jgi:hypothetical protein
LPALSISTKALTLANFTYDEIKILYSQHTDASGQIFEDSVFEMAWYLTEGQPWLVNALAYEAVCEILKNDHSKHVTGDIIDHAAAILIKRRDTHIDSLRERLKKPRVARVMDSVFAGTMSYKSVTDDDRRFCIDLGLVVANEKGKLRPSNAMYREVIGRLITDEIQDILVDTIPELPWTDGKVIFVSDILKEFQQFWRKGSLYLPFRKKKFTDHIYDDALYSFILEAFLQRLVNTKAVVIRELSIGCGAVDIGIIYNQRRYIIEVKLKGEDSLKSSLVQLTRYLETNNEKEGWLVIFDRNRRKKWDQKITWDTKEYDGRIIHVVGC